MIIDSCQHVRALTDLLFGKKKDVAIGRFKIESSFTLKEYQDICIVYPTSVRILFE